MSLPAGYSPEEVTELLKQIGSPPVAEWVREMWARHRWRESAVEE